MRTYRLFVCYFLVLAFGTAISAFVDRSPDGFAQLDEAGAAITSESGV